MKVPGFAALGLGRKLTLLFTAVSGTALLVFAGAVWEYQSAAYRAGLQHEMSTLSQTLADSGAAALAFRDDRSAGETLAVLRAEPRISAACFFRDGGVLAAGYSAGMGLARCPAKPGPDRAGFSEATLTVVQSARLKGDVAGQLWLSVDLGDYYRQLRELATLCAGVLGVSLLLAGLLASRLQRLISGPILGLAAVASQVSHQRDYSIRAPNVSKDELGVLVDRFNEMMGQIQERDTALETAQAELEDRVRSRTRELQDEIATRRLVEQDLLNAKEVAEESNRAKSAILANMSHELRTPLNAIILYSEMLQEDAASDGNEATVADLRCVVAAAKHLLCLINDILDLSRMEAGRLEIRSERERVCNLIAEIAPTIQPLAWKGGNEFVTKLPDEDYLVNVDAVRFRQSLLNLLSNACKFTEHGKISLSVNRETVDNANWICFEVQDTGIGIAEEDQGKLFKTFSQVDSSATRKHGGSGLGLAISQRFCQLMGGDISVASVLGAGSAFTIRLPEAGPEIGIAPEAGERKGVDELLAQVCPARPACTSVDLRQVRTC